jgi:hypothetical protein
MGERSPRGAQERARLAAAVGLALALESGHVAALAQLAARQRGLSLDAKVAEIVARHAPYAGRWRALATLPHPTIATARGSCGNDGR